MGNWTNNVTLDPIEFDGDKVVVTVTRLLTEDMQMLRKYQVDGVFKFTDTLELCSIAAKLFPKYVVGVTGLLKADKTEMTREEFLAVVQEFYFVNLVASIFNKLISASIVGLQEKNSVPPSPESSVALGGEVPVLLEA